MGKKRDVDDRFGKFGTVSFTSITKVNDFVDHLQAGAVATTRCRDCEKVFFPPRADCHLCLGSNVEWVAVAGSGRLITYTRLAFAPAGFQEEVPYHLALVDYGDFKIFGCLADDIAEDQIAVGMQLKTVAASLPNGQLSYRFHKA
jgi:uncharacterized OB-fold protein